MKNMFNYDFKKYGEDFTKPSLTVPDMTMSLRELVERFTRGQEVPYRTPMYDENEDYHELEKLDKIEKLERAKQIRKGIKDMQEELKNKLERKETLAAEGGVASTNVESSKDDSVNVKKDS